MLVALLAISALQIGRDLGSRPDYETRGGVPVVLVERETAPPAGDYPLCWPEGALAEELPELVRLIDRFDHPACGQPLPAVMVLEAWERGRFVWWPGQRLVLERW